jgi:hypothetical protein
MHLATHAGRGGDGHEYFARRAGLADDKIATLATIAAGQRPPDLTHDEGVAYDMAAALNRGGPLPESTYRAALTVSGKWASRRWYLRARLVVMRGLWPHLVGAIVGLHLLPDPGESLCVCDWLADGR